MNALSLSQLLLEVRDVLDINLEPTYWVKAEIASLSNNNGHAYMDLVEKGKNALMEAKVRATCWRQKWMVLHSYFQAETGQSLKPGMQVLLEVSVSLHPVYGLSVNIVAIDPTYTLGDMERKRQETIRRLQSEGVFDNNRQLRLPTLPRRIAVISSDSAAGYGDFCDQLLHNPHGYRFEPTLFPAIMQGDNAAASIMQALLGVQQRTQDFDVVVIIRGGGATTDMACFDDYELALCCTQLDLPIISGIGHTRDTSIVDMVVYCAAKTPTAVAEVLIDHFDQQAERLTKLDERLRRSLTNAIQKQQNLLDRMQQRVLNKGALQLQKQRSQLDLLQKTIELHSPEAIFRKGYALVQRSKKAITTAQSLSSGDQVTLTFLDGSKEAIIQ